MDNCDGNDNNNDDDNVILLFEQEETSELIIHCCCNNNCKTRLQSSQQQEQQQEQPLLPCRRPLYLQQYGSSHEQWGIYSCVWDGGIALLYYIQQKKLFLNNPTSTTNERDPDNEQTTFSNKNGNSSSTNDSLIENGKDDHILYVLDLGAGTGIVGLGIALSLLLSSSSLATEINNKKNGFGVEKNSQAVPSISTATRIIKPTKTKIVITDLKDAIPLLKTNLQRNGFQNGCSSNVSNRADDDDGNNNNNGLVQIQVQELTWSTTTFLKEWFTEWLFSDTGGDDSNSNDNHNSHKKTDITVDGGNKCTNKRGRLIRKKLLITGGDIVYRQSIFQPLIHAIQTIVDHIQEQQQQQEKNDDWLSSLTPPETTTIVEIELLLACQSIRSNLQEFFHELVVDTASTTTRKYQARIVAIVKLPNSSSKNNNYDDDDEHKMQQQQQQQPLSLHSSPTYWKNITILQDNLNIQLPVATKEEYNRIPKGLGLIWIIEIKSG